MTSKEVVMAFYQAFNQNDQAGLKSVLSDNWQIQPPIPGPGSNAEKYLPRVGALFTAMPDVQIIPQIIIAENEWVAVASFITGTHSGADWLGASPKGNAVNILANDFHRVENGQIVESWHVEDWLAGIMQMGAPSA